MPGSQTPPPSNHPRPALLRRGEQALLAAVVTIALLVMMAAWFYQGGNRGRLIEIDRAAPITIQYSVDVNTASWPELAQLPEVGETLARRIVEVREANGPYRDLNDLDRVPGIGPKTLETIKPYLLPLPDDEALVGN